MSVSSRLTAAIELTTQRLLAERNRQGYWEGELSTSALSTATAVSALAVFRADIQQRQISMQDLPVAVDDLAKVTKLIDQGINWLADHQNSDGGFGDTTLSYSNVATSMLVVAAIELADKTHEHAKLVGRANDYIDSLGRLDALRQRYGKDKTFAVPILTNAAIAGLEDWKNVSSLPFELACFPQALYRFLKMPVVSYAIPALVAIGQARYFHKKPLNPFLRLFRWLSVKKSLRVLERMQPESGGYLEAIPLTSFVVMSLASTGRAEHPVSCNGIRFIVESVRSDGSWPIDTNLATWNTSLSINALSHCPDGLSDIDCTDWLLGCQHKSRHPFTGAAPGGWGWSDLSGAVPDCDDTPGALIALRKITDNLDLSNEQMLAIQDAVSLGIQWMIGLQNSDKGWPTFCRGWGKLPFDRSGSDLTAHVLRALAAWQTKVPKKSLNGAIKSGFEYLDNTQMKDGSWLPLWFGNQDDPHEENPIYGTSKVLLAYADWGKGSTENARRGLQWLIDTQNPNGGWGNSVQSNHNMNTEGNSNQLHSHTSVESSIEETALAIDAIMAIDKGQNHLEALENGLHWLIEKVEEDTWVNPSPIGFYFAKLWYYERLYPLIFTVSALGSCRNLFLESSENSQS